jgi:hypothetical protein
VAEKEVACAILMRVSVSVSRHYAEVQSLEQNLEMDANLLVSMVVIWVQVVVAIALRERFAPLLVRA